MSRPIDADALEKDGWKMSRTVRVSKDTMEYQVRNPTDFPTIEPQRMRGKWNLTPVYIKCSECGECYPLIPQNYCPHCGADMRGGQDES